MSVVRLSDGNKFALSRGISVFCVNLLLCCSVVPAAAQSNCSAEATLDLPRHSSSSNWVQITSNATGYTVAEITILNGGGPGYQLNLASAWSSTAVFDTIDIPAGGGTVDIESSNGKVIVFITYPGGSPDNFSANVKLCDGPGDPGDFAIDESTLANGSVNQYDLHEITFDFSALPSPDFEDLYRFDANKFDVYAEITTPSSGVQRMPAFYRQDSFPNWAVRYSPLSTGNHSFKIVAVAKDDSGATIASDESNTYTLNVGAASALGFIEQSSIHSKRMQYSNGDAFVINGINSAWSQDVGATSTPDIDMSYIFGEMANSKMNTARIFLNVGWEATSLEWGSSNNNTWDGISITYSGLGEYNLENAGRLDGIFESALSNDIYLIVALRDHLEFRVLGEFPGQSNPAAAGWWIKSAYSSGNGGHCPSAHPGQHCFITSAQSKTAFKNYMRYVFARYGAFRSFGIVELFNEIDNGGWSGEDMFIQIRPQVKDWQNEMASEWSTNDFYPRLLTTSYAWTDHTYNGSNPKPTSWLQLTNNFTIRNSHMYHDGLEAGDQNVADAWHDQIRSLQDGTGESYSLATRPAFIGEYGPPEGEPDSSDYPNQQLDRFYHDGAWIPFFFAESAGTNLIWRVDLQFAPQPSSVGYKAFGDFLEEETDPVDGLPVMDFVSSFATNNPDVRCAGYHSSNRALVLVRDFSSNANWDQSNAPVHNNVSYTISGLSNGNYSIEFWDTMTGSFSTSTATATNGQMVVSLPTFQRALAVKATFGGSSGSCNVAENKPSTASSEGLYHEKEQANDGKTDFGNYWATGDATALQSYWRVNLGTPKAIREVKLWIGTHWQQSGALSGNYTVQYLIGESWVNVPGIVQIPYVPWQSPEYVLGSPITAQEWRILFANPNQNSYFAVTEFQLCD